jgi:hypothetical protein
LGALAGDNVRQGSNSPLDQYVLEGRIDQPPKRRFVRATSGHRGRRLLEGNWRVQSERQCVSELNLDMI